ncbi:MAG: hypothetical protein K1X39_12400 [Thermoflexales bacterium]|nr:hypothetical protein [Thermoflexales bacterium]
MPETKNTILVKFVVNGEEVGSLLLNEKTFSTGSQGYFGTGKISLADGAEKGYQTQVQMVRIGSKEAAAKAGKSA